jgi:pimeloyl-ACP methyl ester carboxylesterase
MTIGLGEGPLDRASFVTPRTGLPDRYGYADGDPNLDAIERRLAVKPKISVPTVVLHGEGSGLSPVESSQAHVAFFIDPYQRRVIPTVGHNLPQEAPEVCADAVLELIRATK